MTRIFALTLALVFFGAAAHAQQEVSRDDAGNKVIRGFIPLEQLSSDTAFAWFHDNQKDFTPDPGVVGALRQFKDSIYILAFGGTWCGDTKHILPQVSKTFDASGFPQDHFTLIGVDRDKKTVNHLSESFRIENVPTFIVLKNGKEIGRVVEYGKLGMPDREIGQIIIQSMMKK